MGNGFMGKILNVDLDTGAIQEESVPDEIYAEYASGAGLAAYLLYDRIPAGANPLGPDNILGFVSGMLTGSRAFFTGRWMAVGKSPLTGGWGEANAGGWFSYALKRSGYDGIFVRGISKKPVYLKVIDGSADLVDASHLWGLDCVQADDRIKAEVHPKCQIALIGPAGEKRSFISGIVTDQARIAARSGLGAVMGSKNLKAVVVFGKQKIPVADGQRVKALNQEFMDWFNKGQVLKKIFSAGLLSSMGRFMRVSPVTMAQSGELTKTALSKFGTVVTNVLSAEIGDSPIKNWLGSGVKDFPSARHAERLNPQNFLDYQIKKYHCFSCPLGCGGILEINDGPYPLGQVHKPEYESVCALGPLILNCDLHAIFKMNDMLNRAGMDTISAGATVAWAMECCQEGLLSRSDLDGIELGWGKTSAVMALLEKMARREGIGDVLADGIKQASARLGKGQEMGMHAGGQELPMHDSRFDPGFAVSYVLEPTPGRHTNVGYQWIEMFGLHRIFKDLPKLPALSWTKTKYRPDETRSRHLLTGSNYMQFVNGMGGCLFGVQMGGRLNLPAYANAVTGWDHSPEHYLEIGERIQNLRQAFNRKHGILPARDFALPPRAEGVPPLKSGPMKNITIDAKALQKDFLLGRGWDTGTGVPTPQKLAQLGLSKAAKLITNA